VKIGDRTTTVAREQLSGHVVSPVTREHAIMEETFSVRSVSGPYIEDQLPSQESPEMAVRRVGSWCEMAANLGGWEPRSRGMSTVGRCYEAEQ
jgi:hypothetical protein